MTPEELAEELIGTCEGCNPEERLSPCTMDDLMAFDALAFECAECGWWCGVEERNDQDGEPVCDECKCDA